MNSTFAGGGFMGNRVNGLGMGAGIGIAEDVVGDMCRSL